MKKLLALILCAAVMMTVFAGCGGQQTDAGDDAAPGVGGDGQASAPIEGIGTLDGGGADSSAEPEEPAHDFAKASAAFPADEVMFTLDGEEIVWEEFFYWIFQSINDHEEVYGVIEDFAAVAYDDVTISQFILENAVISARAYRAIERQAELMGIALDDTAKDEIADQMASAVESAGGEEGFAEYLTANYCTEECYEYIVSTYKLRDMCFEELYGAQGEKLATEDLLEHVEADGYMMAKHILVKTVDDENKPLSEDKLKAARERAEEILEELDAAGADELEAKFDELMNEHTEDGGIAMFPDGYLFQSGDMVQEFETACTELEEGEYSGLVETSYGYHIILRLPINPDVTPMAYSPYLYYGYEYPLRYLAAADMFASVLSGTAEEIPCDSETAAVASVDLAAIF